MIPNRNRAAVLKVMVILVIYLIFAVAYSIVTPIGRGADEWAHYWYAQFIAQNGRLPASVAERETAGYKSDWPPLYHALTAAVTGWVDTAGPPTFKYRADSLRRQLMPAAGSDAIVHTEDELFPWRQEILVWHLGRFLSIVFSTGTLLATWFLARDVFAAMPPAKRHRPIPPETLALAATATLAFIPRFIFTGMLFNYDSLTLLLSMLFLGLAIRVADGKYVRWGFWGLGALAGLALMTKYLALLLPLVIGYVAWVRWHQQSWAFFWQAIAQAVSAYLLIISWWFAYLVITFNEVAKYGLLLGVLAPLIRGDGSDRTVETFFAWLSGGQAPAPVYIERQSYSGGQVFASFFTTLWGNPVAQPYPLNWFVVAMSLVLALAAIGLIRMTNYELRTTSHSSFVTPRSSLVILLLVCLLPLPLMLVRLFGARDALEAVQGRHLLFLAGPALAVLLVLGLQAITAKRFLLYALPGLLLIGSMSQLVVMAQSYPPPLPVRTAAVTVGSPPPEPVALPGGAQLVSYALSSAGKSLQVDLYWRGGADFAPEDYQLELALVDAAGQTVRGWRSYQTQAHYPTRAWEPGDTVRDSGWLPLDAAPPGDYTVRWRLVAASGPLFEWQPLGRWSVANGDWRSGEVTVWRDGQPANRPGFAERETAQLTTGNLQLAIDKLIGPNGQVYAPVSAGSGWANFIIGADWPPGDYRLPGREAVALRVTANSRNFQLPVEMATPLAADFAGKIKLLGYTLPGRQATPGDGLPITLYWQALDWMGEDFVLFTRLLDNQQAAHGGYDRRPRENYSTLLWTPGEIITDGFAVPVAADAPNGVYWLSVGWYRRAGGQAESLPLVNPDTRQPTGQTAVLIGPLKVGGPPPGATIATAAPQIAANAVFGDQIKLLGFDANQKERSLKLMLYWQALRPPAADYTVFVHVRDAAGRVAAQKDQPPLNGAYPTGLWATGDIIKDEVSVPLDGVAPGRYQVVVGLYNLATSQRLPAAGFADGAVALPPVEVTR